MDTGKVGTKVASARTLDRQMLGNEDNLRCCISKSMWTITDTEAAGNRDSPR